MGQEEEETPLPVSILFLPWATFSPHTRRLYPKTEKGRGEGDTLFKKPSFPSNSAYPLQKTSSLSDFALRVPFARFPFHAGCGGEAVRGGYLEA
jgi:hypothetical protein